MTNKGPYYITTAIAYTSGKPHIGNTFEIIMADSIARYKRADGYDVYFQTGSDEHGQKIEARAERIGMPVKAFVDEKAEDIKRIWDRMNTSYDRFIRTTDEDHERCVQRIFKKLYEQGDIYLGSYSGLYCTECEAFYTKSQIVDENKCPICGNPVHEENEPAYFFKMQKYADRLIEYINTHPGFIQPESRKNEMMNNFLLPGLTDLCVSRTSFKWGIPVDFDPDHVVYVWLDALSNYITGLGYDPYDECGDLYKKYWPVDLHLIGKDIVRFHTIYWPIFLMALGVPLPKEVFGHPWLLQGGEKMSKTKGNVIYADDMSDIFGVDAVRYFVLHDMPYESDGVITWELVVERINSDLVNTLGNLVKRTISMSNKYFDGIVSDAGAYEPLDDEVKAVCTGAYAKIEKLMDELRIADVLKEIMLVFKRLNKYIDETEPWNLAKDPEKKDRLATVLYNLTEGIMIGASLIAPFTPETSEKIAAQLNAELRNFDSVEEFGLYKSGTKVTEAPESLFERLDEKEVMKKVQVIVEKQKAEAAAAAAMGDIGDAKKEGAPAGEEKKAEAPAAKGKEAVEYDDFAKLELRVGTILECREVEKSKKLLCSKVQIGNETRQILSGLRPQYGPEDMVGKKVMVLVNLKPRKMAGLESEGMLLCAEGEDGTIALMTPEKDMPDGSEIC